MITELELKRLEMNKRGGTRIRKGKTVANRTSLNCKACNVYSEKDFYYQNYRMCETCYTYYSNRFAAKKDPYGLVHGDF